MFQEKVADNTIERKRVEDPGLFLMDAVRKELGANKSIEWEEYKETLSKLLWDTVAKGDAKAIEKINLQVKRFSELMANQRRLAKSVDSTKISGEE